MGIKEAAKVNSDAIILMESQFFYSSNQKQLADLAAKNRLPAIYSRGDFVESGGLMSYGAEQSEPYRRVASMIDKILKGTNPADIPVEQPDKVRINHQSESGEANRVDYSTQCFSQSGSGNSVRSKW